MAILAMMLLIILGGGIVGGFISIGREIYLLWRMDHPKAIKPKKTYTVTHLPKEPRKIRRQKELLSINRSLTKEAIKSLESDKTLWECNWHLTVPEAEKKAQREWHDEHKHMEKCGCGQTSCEKDNPVKTTYVSDRYRNKYSKNEYISPADDYNVFRSCHDEYLTIQRDPYINSSKYS